MLEFDFLKLPFFPNFSPLHVMFFVHIEKRLKGRSFNPLNFCVLIYQVFPYGQALRSIFTVGNHSLPPPLDQSAGILLSDINLCKQIEEISKRHAHSSAQKCCPEANQYLPQATIFVFLGCGEVTSGGQTGQHCHLITNPEEFDRNEGDSTEIDTRSS